MYLGQLVFLSLLVGVCYGQQYSNEPITSTEFSKSQTQTDTLKKELTTLIIDFNNQASQSDGTNAPTKEPVTTDTVNTKEPVTTLPPTKEPCNSTDAPTLVPITTDTPTKEDVTTFPPTIGPITTIAKSTSQTKRNDSAGAPTFGIGDVGKLLVAVIRADLEKDIARLLAEKLESIEQFSNERMNLLENELLSMKNTISNLTKIIANRINNQGGIADVTRKDKEFENSLREELENTTKQLNTTRLKLAKVNTELNSTKSKLEILQSNFDALNQQQLETVNQTNALERTVGALVVNATARDENDSSEDTARELTSMSNELMNVKKEINTVKVNQAKMGTAQDRVKDMLFSLKFEQQITNVPQLVVELKPEQQGGKLLHELTACVHFELLDYDKKMHMVPLSLATLTNDNSLLFEVFDSHIHLGSFNKAISSKDHGKLPLNRWVHVCAAWQGDGATMLYLDGVKVANHTHARPQRLCNCDACACALTVTVGNDVDAVRGRLVVNEVKQGFVGRVRDAFVWNRFLAVKDIQKHKRSIEDETIDDQADGAAMTWSQFMKQSKRAG